MAFASKAISVPAQDARFALHLVTPPNVWPPAPPCTVNPNLDHLPCSRYRVAAPPGLYYVYVVVGDSEPVKGIAAASFGSHYSGGINPA
jgi:hypothetical protein